MVIILPSSSNENMYHMKTRKDLETWKWRKISTQPLLVAPSHITWVPCMCRSVRPGCNERRYIWTRALTIFSWKWSFSWVMKVHFSIDMLYQPPLNYWKGFQTNYSLNFLDQTAPPLKNFNWWPFTIFIPITVLNFLDQTALADIVQLFWLILGYFWYWISDVDNPTRPINRATSDGDLQPPTFLTTGWGGPLPGPGSATAVSYRHRFWWWLSQWWHAPYGCCHGQAHQSRRLRSTGNKIIDKNPTTTSQNVSQKLPRAISLAKVGRKNGHCHFF